MLLQAISWSILRFSSSHNRGKDEKRTKTEKKTKIPITRNKVRPGGILAQETELKLSSGASFVLCSALIWSNLIWPIPFNTDTLLRMNQKFRVKYHWKSVLFCMADLYRLDRVNIAISHYRKAVHLQTQTKNRSVTKACEWKTVAILNVHRFDKGSLAGRIRTCARKSHWILSPVAVTIPTTKAVRLQWYQKCASDKWQWFWLVVLVLTQFVDQSLVLRRPWGKKQKSSHESLVQGQN